MRINEILLPKNAEISVMNKKFYDKNNILDTMEQRKILELLEKAGLYDVHKHDEQVEYELYGFLDNRYGIIYSVNNINDTLRHSEKIGENWYLYFFPH